MHGIHVRRSYSCELIAGEAQISTVPLHLTINNVLLCLDMSCRSKSQYVVPARGTRQGMGLVVHYRNGQGALVD